VAEVDLSELERYLRIFQENPDSRVFAPLADLYRRLGRLREAEEIVKEGMERHPYYAGGRVAYAHILLDSGRLDMALQESSQVVTYYPDNLLARKILIRVLGGLGQLARAEREFSALKALAPQIASDPELEQALQGPQLSKSLPEIPKMAGSHLKESIPQAPQVKPGPAQGKSVFNPLEIQEKTDWHPIDQAENDFTQQHRSFRLRSLFKKKLILEIWLKRIEESQILSSADK
jgi:tetratricopeptide (TPR) repeat protein